MNYSSIHPLTITKQKIYVDSKTVFIVLPDTNIDIVNEIYKLNFLRSNCVGLICPNQIYTIGRRKFNGRMHYLDIKKRLLSDEIGDKITRKMKVLNSFTLEREDNRETVSSSKQSKYYFYDATIWSQAVQYMMERLSERAVVKVLFNELSDLYRKIKTLEPSYNVDILMLVKNQSGSFYNILKNIRTLTKPEDIKELKFFDRYVLVSDCENVLIPLFDKEKEEGRLIYTNLAKLDAYIEVNSTVEDLNKIKEEAVTNNSENKEIQTLNKVPEHEGSKKEINKEPEPSLSINKKEPSVLDNIVQSLQASTLVGKVDDQSPTIKVEVNQEELKRILKSYKVTDPDIIANVQAALNDYINRTKSKPTRDEAETIVLKAIHFTIFGTDQVAEKYLHKPGTLFSKLKEIDYYKNDLNIPEVDNLIQPKKIIDLKYTTGQHRQKFEFEDVIHENMAKLFNSLEMIGTEYPIKVKKIDYTIEDNNSDRFINYEVTLQNMGGGKKEPYKVVLKVPSPVNDKYFKLHGNNYIMSNQQFLRPVTKTDKNESRLISNYAIVRIGLANVKFNPSNVEEIIKYIIIKYPKLITSSSEKSYEFSDGSTLYLEGDTIYSDSNITILSDTDSGKLINKKTGEKIKQERFEFIYDVLLNKVQTVNPDEKLTKTKKALPYIWIYLGGIKMPMIMYLWSQKGLLGALNDYGIDYEIVDNNAPEDNVFYIPIKDSKYLKIMPKSSKEQFVVNGLAVIKFKTPIEDLNNPEAIYSLIAENFGSRSLTQISLFSTNFVDPITKELLQFEGMPTNLADLSSKTAVDYLLNKPPDSLSDLKIYRSRLSEIMLNTVYKLVKLSHNTYKRKVISGDEQATVFFDPEWIINELLTTAGVLQQSEPVTPVTEIMMASRVIKSGKGGVPSKKSFKKEHRNIHHSQYGIMGAVSTPEYVDVGLVTHHTLTPVITNKYGSYGAKDINALSGWHTLTLDESLTPFQNQVDSDRLTLARTHANQVTPVSNSEMPLVCTGAEFIVPQLASSRFVHIAKNDGIILEVEKNRTLTIKYKDGTSETFDILPRLSRTKRGAFISLEMDTLPAGTKVKANQPIAFTKNFNKEGAYCAGKNVTFAVLNYVGYNHEDSYVISKSLAEETKTDSVEEVQIIIPPDAKVINLEKEKGKNVNSGDVLVEFAYDDSLEDYLSVTNLDSEDQENETSVDLYSAGSKSIKLLAPEGEIIDIVLYINNKNTADKMLLSFHNNLVKSQKDLIAKLATSIKDKNKQLKITDNMNLAFMNIGGHRIRGNEFLGCRIVYYIKHPKKLNIGDKISNRFGAKGVISKILDPSPKGEFTKEINCFISPISILGRKNIAMLKELYLGKIFYYANLKIEEMADNTKITTDKIAKFITDLYSIIGPKKIADQISQMVNSYSGNKLRQAIKNDEIHLYCIIEPFEDISFENIRSAAKFISIPLEERVYIPELDKWTDSPVPVGIAYYSFLEHYSDVYANVRGTGRFTGLTRQPTKRKAQGGGQSVARLDIYAFLTYNANNIMSELLGPRSDEHRSKRELYNTIIETGEMPSLPDISKEGGTKDLFNLYVTGMGLKFI